MVPSIRVILTLTLLCALLAAPTSLPGASFTAATNPRAEHIPRSLGLGPSLPRSGTPFVNHTLVVFNDTVLPGNFPAGNGLTPVGVADDAAKHEVFVADEGSNVVSVVSATTGRILTAVNVGSVPEALAYDSGNGDVYVANYQSNNVSEISDATNTVIGSVGVGSRPDGIAYDGGTGELFVANSLDANLSVISDASGKVVANVPVGSYPGQVAYDSGKGEIFVVNEGTNNVSVISDSTDKSVASIDAGIGPLGIVYDSGKGEVFVSCNYILDFVAVVSDATNSVVAKIGVGSIPQGMAYDPAQGEVFVANSGSDNVSVLSDATNSVVGTVNAGNYPYFLAYDSGASEVVASNYNSENVTGISAASDSVSFNTLLGVQPGPLADDAGKGEVFLTGCPSPTVHCGQGFADVISDASDTLIGTVNVGPSPEDAAYDGALGEMFVANWQSNNVSVISDASDRVVASITVGDNPYGVVYDSSRGEIFVSNDGTDNVSIISAASDAVVATVPVGKEPQAVAYDSGKGEVFVANANSFNLSVISDTSDKVVATIPIPGQAWGLAYAPMRNEVFFSNIDAHNVSAISDSNDQIVANISVGKDPEGMAYDGGDADVFVANEGSNNVSVISTSTNTLAATLNVGEGPESVTYDPGSGSIYVSNFDEGTISIISAGPPSGGAMLSTVNVSPPLVTLSTGTTQVFTASPTCTGGPCPSGISYVWSMNRVLGTLNVTTGSVVQFTAGGTAGTTYLFVNATLNGVTVESVPVQVTISTLSSGRYTMTFADWPAACPLTFNGTSEANGTTASFPAGSYVASAPSCPGYLFLQWDISFGRTGLVSTSNPVTIGVSSNGTLTVFYNPKPAYPDVVDLTTSRAACTTLEFNGSYVANGTSGMFWPGTYPAYAPPCGGYGFLQWIYLPTTGISRGYAGPWANITIGANATVMAEYLSTGISGPLSVSLSANRTSFDTGQGATLTPSVSGGLAPYACAWSLNGTNTSLTGCTPYGPTFSHGGSYSYRVWATDAQESVAGSPVVTLAVIWETPPSPLTVSFAANTTTLIAGGSALLTPSVSGGVSPYTCLWSLNGTNTTSTGCGPASYTWDHPGSYAYRVWATDAASEVAGSSPLTITVSARNPASPLPLVAFANATSWNGTYPLECPGVQSPAPIFTDQFIGGARGGSPAYHFDWDLGVVVNTNVLRVSTQNTSWTFGAGTYPVSLQVIDATGHSAWANHTLRVASGPSPSCSSTGLSFLGLSEAESVALLAIVVFAVVVAVVVLLSRRRKRGARFEEATMAPESPGDPPL